MSLFSKILAKHASIEYPDQEQVEQDFGSLAFQFSQDRANHLIPYMVGFEVVERNQEGSRVVGVFAYKIGKKFYFVPVFFINGQIKGMVSIYDRDANTFSQLTDSNILSIIAKSDIDSGKSVNRVQQFREADNTSLNFLKSPYTKMGEISEAINSTWRLMQHSASSALQDSDTLREFSNLVAYSKQAEFDPYDPSTSSLRTLVSWLGPKADKEVTGRLLGNEKIASGVASLYGDALALHVRREGFHKEAMEFANDVGESVLPKVEIIDHIDELDKIEDKSHFQSEGFDIKDNRSKDGLSETFFTDHLERISPPPGPGSYEVLLSDGKFYEADVLLPDTSNDKGKAIVIFKDKDCIRAALGNILVSNPTGVNGAGLYSKATNVPEAGLTTDGKSSYVFVNEEGEYLGPYRINEFDKSSTDGGVTYTVTPEYVSEVYDSEGAEDLMTSKSLSWGHEGTASIVLRHGAKGPARRLTKNRSSTLVIPTDSYRYIEFRLDDVKDRNDFSGESVETKSKRLGTYSSLDYYMEKDALYNVSIAKDPWFDSYTITSSSTPTGKLNYKQACILLTHGYGLSASDTKSILKKANTDGNVKSTILVKSAQFLPEQDVMIPHHMFPEFQGVDPYSGSMLQEPQYAELEGTEPNYLPPNDPMRFGLQDQPFATQPMNNLNAPIEDIDDVFELAQLAAESGQKTVFDHAGIAGLSKLYDIGSLIDSYVPEMQKAVDRLGRLAFLFYWRNDGFAERFGSDSLPEVEDTLLSIYRQFGDLVVKLNEKPTSTGDKATF